MSLFAPSRPPLQYPGSKRRVFRRPDFRHAGTPDSSGAPLSTGEVDYDDLIVHRAWRSFDHDRAGEVRYFMYEVSQRNPGEGEYTTFFKAARICRLTRVPRYLRQASANSGPTMVFQQMRDVLTAMREQQTLFLNIIAKSPEMPLVFGYGVQAWGFTPEEAQAKADESYAVLTYQLDGTYQQLEYAPITLQEGEQLSRYQSEWQHIAMARGRPMPVGQTLGASGIFDGNRTDVDSTNNQLESFIRGMSDSCRRGFMMSLVTVPVSPAEISYAWRNMAKRASDVRSDQEGTRGFTAGVALPFMLGNSIGEGHGTVHQVGQGETLGAGHGTSVSHADSTSQSQTDSTSLTHTNSVGTTDTSVQGLSASQGLALGHSVSDQASSSVAHGQNVAHTDGVTEGQSVGQSVNHGQSLSNSQSQGQSWGQASGTNAGASLTNTDGISASHGSSLAQQVGLANTQGDSASSTAGTSGGSSVSGGLLGFGGSGTAGHSESAQNGVNASNQLSSSLTGTGTRTDGINQSMAQGITQGVSQTASIGGQQSAAVTATNSATVGQSVGQSAAQSASLSAGQSLTQGAGLTHGAGVNEQVNAGAGVSSAQAQSVSQGQAVANGTGQAHTAGTGATNTVGANEQTSRMAAMTDAYSSALTRQTAMTGTLGAVPNVGAMVTRVTRDLAKQSLGDVLEAQLKRYTEAIDGAGAYLYQLFLVCEDRETLVGAAGLLKSAFWGPGGENGRVGSPFHVITDFGDGDEGEAERGRLLNHARAFTSYRRREPRLELIEPLRYSSYVTPGEMAAFCHPPTAEAIGLKAQADSMPVMAMPGDRDNREITLGRIINGERARVDERHFGIDADELTHTLVTGTTGSGKTTTLMRLLDGLVRVERQIQPEPTPTDPAPRARNVPVSILGVDWMENMRHVGTVLDPVRVDPNTGERTGRFQLFSVTHPELGAFRWNPLAVPDEGMNPLDWMNTQADNFTASMGLGEFGRSLIAEFLDILYRANRLGDTVLMPARADDEGHVLRHAVVLPGVDRATLPAGAIHTDSNGTEYANCLTCPALSRLVGMEHLAVLCAAKVEELATPEGARLYGTGMRDRIQSLWRRLSYYAPGGQFAEMICADPSLDERRALGVLDIVDPDRGLVSIIETEGLDQANRRLLLGSVILALYRYGLYHKEGTFDHHGTSPGLFVVLEEAHELFGKSEEGEDSFTVATRTALWETIHRRARALGMRLIDCVQNPGDIPEAITSNTPTVLVHRTYAKADRERVFSLLNWSNILNQQVREWRYLGEMPVGYCIARLNAKTNYLESQPVHFLVEPASLGKLSDTDLSRLATLR